ncbi:response regulator [Vibrio sp. SM6]|uniref:Response regulator n=1 Tax=Vibrio agarilyticus TaxID=2726741 RepID=A0A7X8TPN1_9VIBR|nr:response regulator [Vibrio agarilyticus]NLS12620.1 response regulator [Vibrio agarilyticus]
MDKLYVICVDDQREVLSAVFQDLAPLETWLNIEECESASEALELMDELDAEGQMIALIISDHVMPGKTGVELLTEISKDARFVHTRKVLLTGQATHADTINAINSAGIDRYFEKPWQADQLVECAKTLVTHYLFDAGLDYSQYHEHLDQDVVLARLR